MSSSHALLYDALQDILHSVQGEANDLDEARELALSTIDHMVETVRTGKRHAVQQAATTIEGDQVFLTHDYSSTVVEAVGLAVADGAQLATYATRACPRLLGREFARELTAINDVEPHLVVDGASEVFLPECDRVIIGMDCIVEGTFYNRIGAFLLVTIINEVDVPVMVVGSDAKVANGGFRFGNEIRSLNEVMPELVESVELENPAYNAASVDPIDKVITDEGAIEF